jgi:SPP1 family predicted phage head-tail adaptor
MAVDRTIPAGLINKPVTFKQPVSSLNDEGGKEVTFTDAISTRAFVDRFNQYRANEVEAVALIGALDFYIRWAASREAITKDWLINYKGSDYTIHQIEQINQKQKFIRFTAKAKE